MDSSYITNPMVFLVEVVFQVYILAVLLRFLLQWARADFNNSISQLVVKVTSPLLIPMRRVVPPLKGVDAASLILAWLLKALELLLIVLLGKGDFLPLLALLGAIPALIEFIINIFIAVIVIQAIMSWVAIDTYHPLLDILNSLSKRVLAPFRSLIPPTSGFDFSPMVAVLALILLKMLLLPPLRTLAAGLAA